MGKTGQNRKIMVYEKQTTCMEENTLKQTNIPYWKIPNFLLHQKETNLFPPKIEERERTTETYLVLQLALL